ncbi:NKP2 (YLR315W) [Zygosaccharomyces parabailii]|nr:NKP2 (YLR315W) [Zygosaccharomyces parabailii]CDH15438.1 uncharacterized protein ZBAI_07225 [Zygosaccharomyces bailii ISA1307]
MSSKELLLQYVRERLISHNYDFEEFLRTIGQTYRSRHESEPEIDTVRDWYSKYEYQDEAALEVADDRINKFLEQNREAELHELENMQIAESFSLEQVVNKLYQVDQMLDERLTYMNEALKKNVLQLERFDDLLELANSTKVDENEDMKAVENLHDKLKIQKSEDE